MYVGEACKREVVIIGREGSIREAARLMREHHVGDLVVVEERDHERHPVGILTDRDIVIEILSQDIDLDSVDIGDAMSFDLLTAREDDDFHATIKRMRSKGVRRIPVVDRKGVLLGILAMDDLIEMFAEQLGDLAALITKEQMREREIRV
jgi:CBS domain-containing protein